MANKDQPKDRVLQTGLRAVCLGAGLALISALLLLLPLSALLSAGTLPERYMAPLCCILLALTALLGGRFAVKRGEAAPLLLGGATGLLLCLLLLASALFTFGAPSMQLGSLWVLLSALLGATISSFFGRGKAHKRRKKH